MRLVAIPHNGAAFVSTNRSKLIYTGLHYHWVLMREEDIRAEHRM